MLVVVVIAFVVVIGNVVNAITYAENMMIVASITEASPLLTGNGLAMNVEDSM